MCVCAFDHRALSLLSPSRLVDVRLALVADELAVGVVRRDGLWVRRVKPQTDEGADTRPWTSSILLLRAAAAHRGRHLLI